MSLPDPEISFEQAAVKYAARGWRVLPVHPGEKRPVGLDWQKRASTEIPQIFDWWIDNPRYNVGIATGRESGIFVLDVDPKAGGDVSLVHLTGEHGALPRTYTVRTQSGGTHLYFKMPSDFTVTNSPGRLRGTGIDVRGEGGQVVAPPSVTPKGSYIVAHDAPVAPAPTWLLDLIRPQLEAVPDAVALVPTDPEQWRELRDYTDRAVAGAVRTVAEAQAGGRNQTLNDQVLGIAGIAAHDATLVDRDEFYRSLEEACGVNGLIADDGSAALRKTFGSAWQAGLAKPRRQWPPITFGNVVNLRPGVQPQRGERPVVQVSQRKLNELVDEILANIAAANDIEPEIFVHGSEVVKVVVDRVAHSVALDRNMLAYEADVRMHFEKQMPKGGSLVVNAPARVVDTLMSLPAKPFPQLTRITATPYFSPSGELITTPGYHAESETFYSPTPGLTIPEIGEKPTQAQARAALSYVDAELLVDFPFVSDADKAHAIALMLLPFVRSMIAGPTPLHDIEAPSPGSGKGKLMRVLLTPALGGKQVTAGAAHTDDEWEKRLVSFLRLSPPALVIDNVNDKISSGFLCTALTEPEISSRLLGVSEQVTIPVHTVWAMTANNPKFSDEVARRTIRSRVDSGVERPEDRTGFHHPDIVQWAEDHRGELVAACCTMIAGWVAAGAPEPVLTKPLGSFERWHAVMAGLLDFLGVPGLLGNKEEFLSAGDDESDAWISLVHILSQRRTPMGEQVEFTSSEIADIVVESGLAIDLGKSEAGRSLVMGRQLAKQRDRWHDGQQFVRRMLHGKSYWSLRGVPQF